MIVNRIELDPAHNVYLDCYLHENVPQWDYVRIRPAVVVCPGGGYGMCSPREADPIAQQYLAAGYHAFVLYYSLNQSAAFPKPLLDLSAALKTIRQHAEEWSIAPDQIAVCGFSAGGHLTASLGTLWNHPEIIQKSSCLNEENRPNALILGYPATTTYSWLQDVLPRLIGDRDKAEIEPLLNCAQNIGPQTPPTFLVHTFADSLVSVEESLSFADGLTKANIPFEMHIFPYGDHGKALGNKDADSVFDPSFSKWMELSVLWLDRVFSGKENQNPPRAKQIRP